MTNPESTNQQYIFTVFTPAYNRAYTLHRVYESLVAQTFRDFEWLIVDDGSKDNTKELVEGWQQIAQFPIRYIYQQNGGKNSASNLGAQMAKGELFLTLDSDDRCMPNALERLYYHWENIPIDRRDLFSAVTGLCQDVEGNTIGDRFPQDEMDAHPLDIFYRYGVRGEKWGFQRTDVMKEFPFPVMAGQHIDDGTLWTQIAVKYQTRFVNEIFRTYYLDNIGNDQLIHQDPRKRSQGMVESRKYLLNNEIEWAKYAPLEFLRQATHYNRFGFHINSSIGKQIEAIDSIVGKLLVTITIPLGWLVYRQDLQRLNSGPK